MQPKPGQLMQRCFRMRCPAEWIPSKWGEVLCLETIWSLNYKIHLLALAQDY